MWVWYLSADRDVKDDHMKSDREGHRYEKPWVTPRGHLQEGAVLREGIKRIEHLDDDEDREGESGGRDLLGQDGVCRVGSQFTSRLPR